MKRLILTTSLLAIAGIALAQGAFTIRRPLDGQKVRETVKFRIPVDSIPGGVGYVGIWVNGRFLEAVAPTPQNTEGKDFVYSLNTKERKIPDGRMTVEAVLYAADARFTRRLNKTQVTVTLDNSASIKIPAEGLKLRYSMLPNTEFTYTLKQKIAYSNLTQEQFLLDPDLTQVEQEGEAFRYRYAWLNREKTRNGWEGLVLAQILTDKGKDFAMITTAGATEPKKFYDFNMSPVYYRVTSTGKEIWGSSPFFVSSEGALGEQSTLNLYGSVPLPLLPSGGIRPNGMAFPSGINLGVLDLEKIYTQEKFSQIFPGRGTLMGIEFERGRPCAHYRVELAQGNDLVGVQTLRTDVWFALDLGMPIRIETRQSTRVRVTEAAGGGAGGAGGNGGRPGAATGSSGGQETSSGGRAGRIMGPANPKMTGLFFGPSLLTRGEMEDMVLLRQEEAGAEGGRGGRAGRDSGNGQAGNGGRPGGSGAGGGARTRTRIVTQSSARIMVME